MSNWQRDFMDAAAWAALLSTVTISATLIPHLILGMDGYLYSISNIMLLEFALLLVAGGCLMAQQPLNDEGRYDSEGRIASSWKWALVGKKLLITALFIFAITSFFFILGGLF